MSVIKDTKDLTYLSFTHIRSSSGTAGTFLKATDYFSKPKTYYKLSNFDYVNGIVGHECVNELIVDRLLDLLNVSHLHYDLIHADIIINDKKYNTYLCSSKDFKKEGESKIALDTYYELERINDESPLEFCIRNYWDKYIYEMLVVDYLILNRDRHGANIEVLKNPKDKSIRLAPLFDNGLSLLFNCYSNQDIDNFDVLEDKRVQCFVGSNSLKDNLNLIPKDKLPKFKRIEKKDKDILFKDLDGILSNKLQDKIFELIYKRSEYYGNFCNKKQIG